MNARADRLAKEAAYEEYARKENLTIKEDNPKKNAKIVTLEVNTIDVSNETKDEQCWTKR